MVHVPGMWLLLLTIIISLQSLNGLLRLCWQEAGLSRRPHSAALS